jgi:hypothetical protein
MKNIPEFTELISSRNDQLKWNISRFRFIIYFKTN